MQNSSSGGEDLATVLTHVSGAADRHVVDSHLGLILARRLLANSGVRCMQSRGSPPCCSKCGCPASMVRPQGDLSLQRMNASAVPAIDSGKVVPASTCVSSTNFRASVAGSYEHYMVSRVTILLSIARLLDVHSARHAHASRCYTAANTAISE